MALKHAVMNPLPDTTAVPHCTKPEVVLSSNSRRSKRLASQPAEHGQPDKRLKLSPVPPALGRELTKTEHARREKLESQPLAIPIDPMNVGCKRCGGLVKLTKHHLYDLSHWKTHRERCDKWSKAELEARLEKSTFVSSRFSTPSLILDAGSDLTDLSDSERGASPCPDERGRAVSRAPSDTVCDLLRPVIGPFSSHLLCAEYLAIAHPGAKVIDLNAPLDTIPDWSFDQLKLPSFINPSQAEIESRRCILSPANWAGVDSDDEDQNEGHDRVPSSAPATHVSEPATPSE